MKMTKKISLRENLKWKEVKFMTRILGIIVLAIMVGIVGMWSTASAELLVNKENVLFFNDFEIVFDEAGDPVVPGSRTLQEGDILFGLINVQNVDAEGSTHWFSSATDQITGVIAQRVEVYNDTPNDPYDAAQTNFPHLILGPVNPAAGFTLNGPDGTSVDLSTLVSGNEIISLWRDTGMGTTVFESNGTFAQDTDIATDGSLWMTLGYDFGADGDAGTIDDTGYLYSHPNIDPLDPLVNFSGEFWGGLDLIVNNTGLDFDTINDPNELEMGGPFLPGNPFFGDAPLFNAMHLSGELEINPNWVDGFSPWVVRSNDPAHLAPVPEPATISILGLGLLGMGLYRKIRR
jgi:hypothetical protein